jgi:hypothetical protein
LILGWVAFAVAELFHPDFYVSPGMIYQGVALAVVFVGYAVGWRWELLGGLLAIAGTAAFFAVYAFIVGTSPLPEVQVAWFATPGVLYLEAWRCERHGSGARSRKNRSTRPLAV